MRQCGFVILLLLGIFTNYESNVDAASLREDCGTLKTKLEQCSPKEADATYCGTEATSCLGMATEATSKGCADTAAATVTQKCDKLRCGTLKTELEQCSPKDADATYCGTEATSCLGMATEATSKGCADTAAATVTQKCDKFRCGTLKTELEQCSPKEADATYCGTEATSCLGMATEATSKGCADTAAATVIQKCEKTSTTEVTLPTPSATPPSTLSPDVTCGNYLKGLFGCWDDGRIFPTSCEDGDRYSLYRCVDKANKDNVCEKDIFKNQYLNMVKFINTTEQFLCDGKEPKLNDKCRATVSRDIIISSFSGDMNECKPLLFTIEMLKKSIGIDECTTLIDEYVVEIKKIDYCQAKPVPTEEQKDKDGGSANLSGNVRLLGVLSIVLTLLFAVY